MGLFNTQTSSLKLIKNTQSVNRTLFNQTKRDRMHIFHGILFLKATDNTKTNTSFSCCQLGASRRICPFFFRTTAVNSVSDFFVLFRFSLSFSQSVRQDSSPLSISEDDQISVVRLRRPEPDTRHTLPLRHGRQHQLSVLRSCRRVHQHFLFVNVHRQGLLNHHHYQGVRWS